MSSHIYSKVEWQFKNIIFKAFQYKLGNSPVDYTTNIVLFGSGRSGTTWLGEVLSAQEGVTLIDEPLKLSNSYRVQSLGFTGWGQYIPEYEKNWGAAHKYFQDLLTGREFNPNHVLNHNKNIFDIFFTKVWLFKFIRAHFLMPWLLNNFEVRKPIFIIRNPYSVIASQMQHVGWGLGKQLKFDKPILVPNSRYYKEFYAHYQERFSKIQRLEELLALRWVMENEFVVNHPYHNKKWHTITYEDLYLNPCLEINKIQQACGINLSKNILDNLFKPSKSAKFEMSFKDKEKQLIKWKRQLSEQQITLIKGILDNSNIKDIYKPENNLANRKVLQL